MSKDTKPMKFDFGVGEHTEMLDIASNPFAMQSLMERIREEKGKVDHLPVQVQRRVWALKNLHKQYASLEKLYKEEVRQLERKYQKLYDPLFARRAEFAAGLAEPTEAEAQHDEPETEEKGKVAVKPEKVEEDVTGIPVFWLTALKNCASVARIITTEDEEGLKYLHDIQSTALEGDKQGFVLSFHFKENPFFTNNVLTKTYYLVDDEPSGDLIFDHVEATKIDWKAGKNLTVKLVTKKQKTKASRGRKPQVRTKTVEEPCDSFFRFFSPPVVEDEHEIDDEEQDDLDAALEEDFQVGCLFKDRLIRQAVLWFTGEAYDDSYDDYYGEDEDEDGLEGLGDAEEDEDDEEEERPRVKAEKKRGTQPNQGNNAKPNQGEATQQPECKQQ